jgi:hypothetical protein
VDIVEGGRVAGQKQGYVGVVWGGGFEIIGKERMAFKTTGHGREYLIKLAEFPLLGLKLAQSVEALQRRLWLPRVGILAKSGGGSAKLKTVFSTRRKDQTSS